MAAKGWKAVAQLPLAQAAEHSGLVVFQEGMDCRGLLAVD
jgi:hypothetical protein